jgi:phospholipid transport system substrate-binding protein
MARIEKIHSMGWLVLAICWASVSTAQLNLAANDQIQSIQQEQTSTEVIAAYQMVEAMTDDLLLLIEAAQRYSANDKQRFFVELDDLLRPVIDFQSFSRAVMGRHASAKKMAMLSTEEQQRLNLQIDRFSGVFSMSLIQTYGKGLLAFEGQKIEVVVPAEFNPLATKARVKQLIYGDRQQPYEIQYTLRKNSKGQWKLRNMVVESINLGMIYRNQFDSAVEVYEGNIDKVIDNWSASGDDTTAEVQ